MAGTTTPHGEYTRYCFGGCRCRPCKDAWSAYQRTKRAESRARRLAAKGTYIVEGIRHGASGYSYHSCRCDACVEGRRAMDQRSRLRRAGV